jgi:hypothetical protein
MQGITSTSEIDPTKKAIDKPEEEPKLAAIPKEATVVQVSLRRQPKEISDLPQITDMLMEYDFFDQSKNAYGAFVNGFIDNNDGTVTDRATGLMWQKGGSKGTLDNRGAKRYIKQINKQRFAGYSDWRMPTVEELASLLEKSKINGLHLNPLFSSEQKKCWTIDQGEGHDRYYLGGWIVNFELGEVTKAEFLRPFFVVTGSRALNPINYIKAVRSVKQ